MCVLGEMWVWYPWEPRASDPPAAGIAGSYGLPGVGAGNWIQALYSPLLGSFKVYFQFSSLPLPLMNDAGTQAIRQTSADCGYNCCVGNPARPCSAFCESRLLLLRLLLYLLFYALLGSTWSKFFPTWLFLCDSCEHTWLVYLNFSSRFCFVSTMVQPRLNFPIGLFMSSYFCSLDSSDHKSSKWHQKELCFLMASLSFLNLSWFFFFQCCFLK